MILVMLVLAFACFIAAVFNINNRFFSWVPMGLALWVLTVIIAGWSAHPLLFSR
jgi:hypothetical protein